MKVIGVREEKYIGTTVSGHNCDFKYEKSELTRHVILGLLNDGTTKVEITLETEYGECGSGWCTATFGNLTYKKVNKFGGYNYKPNQEIILDDFFSNNKDYDNDLFSVSNVGGDGYYPEGSYTINMGILKPTPRVLSKRPTYVFKGESGIGKSWLASGLADSFIIFETDLVDELPEKIIANVVVIGNKTKNFSNEDIYNRISKESEIIICNMEKYNKE